MRKVNYLQVINSGKIEPYRLKCMESLRSKVGKHNYRVIEIEKKTPVEMVRESDRIRFELAKSDPELCYVDSDCFIVKPIHEFIIKDKVPYFGEYDFESTGYADTFYFYVNGCTEYFNDFMDNISPGYSLTFDFVKSLKGFEFIERMSYYHQYSTMRNVVKEEKTSDENRKLIVKLATIRKVIETAAIVLNG